MHLFDEVKKIEESHSVDYIHFDIMDGNFVPNISFGPYISELIAKKFSIPVETHLMVSHPINFVDKFYFSESVIFHIESNDPPVEVINKIKFFFFSRFTSISSSAVFQARDIVHRKQKSRPP